LPALSPTASLKDSPGHVSALHKPTTRQCSFAAIIAALSATLITILSPSAVYIFTHQIPTIEAEIFEPKEDEFFEKNGIMYKNSFKHSIYLNERLSTYRGVK
jgi:hypothetical protein